MEPESAQSYQEGDVIDLRQLWMALYRRKWLVVASCFIAIAAAYIFTSLATPMYEARTTLLI